LNNLGGEDSTVDGADGVGGIIGQVELVVVGEGLELEDI
jgi:hypothetical protein